MLEKIFDWFVDGGFIISGLIVIFAAYVVVVVSIICADDSQRTACEKAGGIYYKQMCFKKELLLDYDKTLSSD